MGIIRTTALLFFFAGCCFTQTLLKLTLVKSEALQQRLRAGEVKLSERQDAIQRLFQEAGCQPTLDKINKRFSNVVCTLPGQTADAIIVGGHFDFVDAGQGIVDDWSGASLLPSLYETLKDKPWKHTFRFVAFGEEERELVGSTRYVKNLSAEDLAAIRAFVNIECLGTSTPKVWGSRSTPSLVSLLANLAASLHIPLASVNVEKVGDDDTHPFFSKKLPVISIHSLTQDTFTIIHSKKDTVAAVDPRLDYEAYRLIAFYLALLDDKL